MRSLAFVLAVLAAPLVQAQVRGEAGGVYVAADGQEFEAAAYEALRDRASSPANNRLLIVVMERDLEKLTTQRAIPATREILQKLASANVVVYTCERDLRAQRLVHSDLLGGVRIERGWSRAEAAANVGERDPAKDGTPEAQLRRVRRLCAEA